jgi:BirA family biotin operon repressor/biotin-[acetyl-CoA-carboxylase] ligase
MLNESRLRAGLPVEGMGAPLYIYPSLGSTNDHAKQLAAQGAPHGTLVTADEQTAGRGRMQRRWVTKAGSGLAISVILRPTGVKSGSYGWLAGLGALAVVQGLETLGLSPRIKWPNDVLLERRKVAGVLAETAWQAGELDFVVLGMGVNVRAGSLPPREALDYPASYVDAHSPRPVDREGLLIEIVRALGLWADRFGTPSMLQRWQERLAFNGEVVIVSGGDQEIVGEVVGLNEAGRLVLRSPSKERLVLGPEAMTIRPVDRLVN